MKMDWDTLITFIVFPRVLPEEKSRYFDKLKLEMMHQMVQNINKLRESIPSKTIELFERIKRIHDECTYNPEIVSQEIKALRPGDTLAMIVRRQNCVIMIHMLPNDETHNVVVATFPGNLHPNDIYNNENGFDIEFNYPSQAFKVTFSDMLRSQDFANQLCFLYERLPVETTNRNYVSKWLTTVLMDEHSTTATTSEFPVITKKFRDELMGADKKNYFRRSSFYMSLKVLLQHSLTMQLGAETGKFLYKVVMLKFLVQMCAVYKEPNCVTFNIDLLSQMIAKLGRRIEKMYAELKKVQENEYTDLFNEAIREAKETIQIIRNKINNQISKIHQQDKINAQLPPLTNLNFQTDIHQRMPKLREYLNEISAKVSGNDSQSKNGVKTYRRYFKDIKQLPKMQPIPHADLRMYWIDFENFVLYSMTMENDNYCANELREWAFAYTKYAEENYKGDELFISRMVLVRLKLIAILDQLAIKQHPLLNEHRTSINLKIIEPLLLPQRFDMEIAYQLEEYFGNRNNTAIDPGLIEERSVSGKSFSVKYAKNDHDMTEVRAAILKLDEKGIQEKNAEWIANRIKAENLRKEARLLSCTYRRNWHGNLVHSKYDCKRCILDGNADTLLIRQYEHLLPEKEIEQHAVVFELRIPIAIACLRDVLFDLINYFDDDSSKDSNIIGDWINSTISTFNKSSSQRVTLGSTTKRSMENFHVDNHFERFIVENTFNCIFHANKKELPVSLSDEVIQEMLAFKMQGDYVALQWTVKSTVHTQNQVLASQSECPQSLSLSEYKNFGSLRADGHRLQLRKLYAMIETEALSFEKDSVFFLIMQTLWACEAFGNAGFIRESHINFSDPTFCSGMITLLKKFIDQQESNWVNPFKLLMATLTAVRAFEINDNEFVANETKEFLNRIRRVAISWISSIDEAIKEVHNEKNVRELRLKIIYVAIAGSLTFFVHPNHRYFENIFLNNTNNSLTAAQLWLHFIITLKNNIILYENDENELPSNVSMFLRMIECTGVYLEAKMQTLILPNSNEVHELIRKQWPRADSAPNILNHFDPDSQHILVVQATIDSSLYDITIDIITGDFLVNGSPVSRLPVEITQNKTYQWFFGKMTLEVQPDGQDSFTTVQKYNDCMYEFKKHNDDVRIIERNGTTIKELIPNITFEHDFPHTLVYNYSHWWNKNESRIEFRCRNVGQRHFSDETEIEYRLNLENCYLIHEKTERIMVDIMSESYTKIVGQLSRLEHPKYIHVLVSTKQQVADIELLQIKLKFRIDYSNATDREFTVESNEFSRMRVSRKQKIGTLYGLNHGLILENISNTNTKILLIPHGSIHIDRIGQHVSVDINTEKDIRNPAFYEYQVDEFCQQLKASDRSHASWFYLAYLHAITSHGEIEPFIGMSGTERALQILQSAFAWSSSPYEQEAINMLKAIARLSPNRELKENKQIIVWPANIQPRAAQDSFIFIVRKLIEDSQRLHALDLRAPPKVGIEIKTDLKLNKRDYYRCLQLQPNLRVSNTFIEEITLKTSLPRSIPFSFCRNTQTVSTLYHKREYQIPATSNLKSFLNDGTNLLGLAELNRAPTILDHSGFNKFRDLWIDLYDSIRKQQLNDEQITLILSLFAHQNNDIDAILALQTVALNRHVFEQINPPAVNEFFLSKGSFDIQQVKNILKNHYTKPAAYENWEESQQTRHKQSFNSVIDGLAAQIKRQYPCDRVEFENTWQFDYIDFRGANDEINKILTTWNNNLRLDSFIEDIVNNLKRIPIQGVGIVLPQYSPFATLKPQNWRKYDLIVDLAEKINENLAELKEEVSEAQDVWNMEDGALQLSAKDWQAIIERIYISDRTRHLIQAGLFPRSVPSMILPMIIIKDADNRMKALTGAWAIAIVKDQRKRRIDTYSQRPEFHPAMQREMDNEPHCNWKPCEYPEWLLFEIEQNLTIRPIQIEIAQRMIEPPSSPEITAKHSVMQLNMGEGKTAVIVPILAAFLADGTQACQITVLKSLFSRNLKFLRQYLGGMLNKRLYTFPCRRDKFHTSKNGKNKNQIDMPVSRYVKQILDIYEECKIQKGVILTLPEYRLSFQLKIYESIENGDIEASESFLDVHNWINANVRNILDESDAILQANYQLIYTMGNQQKPDGEALRWSVIQALLKRVPHHLKRLYEKHGNEKIEFNDKYVENGHVFGAPIVSYRSDVFTPCRILDEDIFEELKTELAEDIVNRKVDISLPEIRGSLKKHMRNILTQKNIEKKTFQEIDRIDSSEKNIIMILWGLLRFDVLQLALTKRWRVNYGVDTKGRRKMAIPFKAKDIAAEMIEFGHLDVAICFTQMSYYYSGLTDDQLRQIFDILGNGQSSAAIYEKWIESIPSNLIDASISSYSGVNLDDPNQRDNLLFPLLRFNMHVIDFWLSNVVYPHEAKVFEKKLMCSVWDLCSEQLEHRVTGFSGTNDTKNILPLPVAQNDLQKLENTNDKMRQVILQPENQSYENLLANFSGKEILERLTARGIPVLLDSGALMLELTNKGVAVEWLKMAPNALYDAAVYFDTRDVLQTIDRTGIVTEFDCSVYRENLSRCLVYLDDVHTRGTDLKFPLNWKACVTLSGDITRDKTVQSCMRMRQLGTNHSICFWASNEADVNIRKTCSLSPTDPISNEHVIKFICKNSDCFETRNMSHWSAAALNYTKKLVGHRLLGNNIDEESMRKLYDICVDEEFVCLREMYGDKEEVLLSKIACAKFNKLLLIFSSINDEILSFIQNKQRSVMGKLNEHALDVKKFSHALDEEQEKELEQEIEEQRYSQRPPRINPAEPIFDKRLEQLIRNGATDDIINAMKVNHSLLSITESLTQTQLYALCEDNEEAWSSHLLVTKDFKTVVVGSSKACDQFLRPIWWIARVQNPIETDKYVVILMSSFECNRLLPVFRESSQSTLFAYRPRLSKLHSNLLHEAHLRVTGMSETEFRTIDLHDEVQIAMYAGSMYFKTEAEQKAYCGFMGLIPLPRTELQDIAAGRGVIRPNGFVFSDNREYNEAISSCVRQCQFEDCPIELATKLIEAHHKMLIKEAHVGSIFEGKKQDIENGNAE